ncbi:MAG: 6-carboxytetrahydropterin synthase QueD [Candidatus Omnitrophota bacterium]
MGYSITVEKYFSAAHKLRGYQGKCESLHGHNWKVHVTISSGCLDKIGMVMDFKDAKKILDSILDKLDHTQLSKLSFFKKYNPTSERIAEYIFKEYQKKLKNDCLVQKVIVWETATSSASFDGK